MTEGKHGTAVDIYHRNGTTKLGYLVQSVPLPRLVYKNGSQPSSNSSIHGFRVIDSSHVWRNSGVDVGPYSFPPMVTTESPYSTKQNAEDLYPPSTGSWLKHTGATGSPAMYCVYSHLEKPNRLLVITSPETGQVQFVGRLKPYELGILKLERDDDLYRRLQRESREPKAQDPYEILAGPPPSIDEFKPLVDAKGGVGFQYNEDSFEKTVDSLVPKSFPEEIRMQLRGFYAHVVAGTMPKKDPLDFIQSLADFSILRGLLAGHIRCLKGGVKPPDYVSIMMAAEKNGIQTTAVPLPGQSSSPAWFKGWIRIYEELPSWFHRVSRYAEMLSKQDTVSMKIPVTREQALKSDDAWADRMAFAIHGFLMRAQIRQDVLGLKHVLYLGSAYRWPHKHTAWSARLNRGEKTPWYIQVMLMPPRAVSKVKNRVPGAISVDWMTSRINLRLFDEESKQWNLSVRRLVDSLKTPRKTKEVHREFRIREREKVVTLSPLEARVLGFASLGFYLEILEAGTYSQRLGTSNKRLQGILSELMAKRVFSMSYMPTISLLGNLYHIGVEVKGDEGKINSLLRAFLRHAPTSTVFMEDTRKHGIVVSRVPARAISDLIGKLPKAGQEAGLDVSVWPVSSYVAYTNDLYSRLLLEDGRWDDDVSGLTSQSRSTSPDDEKPS